MALDRPVHFPVRGDGAAQMSPPRFWGIGHDPLPSSCDAPAAAHRTGGHYRPCAHPLDRPGPEPGEPGRHRPGKTSLPRSCTVGWRSDGTRPPWMPHPWTATRSCAAAPAGARGRSRRWCPTPAPPVPVTSTPRPRRTGVRYTYRVKAIRNGARSPWSNYAEATPLLSAPTQRLVGNTGQSPAATAGSISQGQQYAVGFRLGSHGQGYEISSVLHRPGRGAVRSGRLAVDRRPSRDVHSRQRGCATQAVRLQQPGLLQGRPEPVHGSRRGLRLPECQLLHRALGFRLVAVVPGDGVGRRGPGRRGGSGPLRRREYPGGG